MKLCSNEAVIPHSSFPQPLATTTLLYVSIDLSLLHISLKWNYTVCDFYVWIISLNIMVSRFIHVVVCIDISLLFIAE